MYNSNFHRTKTDYGKRSFDVYSIGKELLNWKLSQTRKSSTQYKQFRICRPNALSQLAIRTTFRAASAKLNTKSHNAYEIAKMWQPISFYNYLVMFVETVQTQLIHTTARPNFFNEAFTINGTTRCPKSLTVQLHSLIATDKRVCMTAQLCANTTTHATNIR